MSQSKRHSLLEATVHTMSGFVLALLLNLYALPLFGFHPSFKDSFWMTCLFCSVSMIRGYIVRRAFNWMHISGVL